MTDRKILKTQCCIAGGGPAGVMLGYLLARQGVQVVVLEKHADFFRDFRGDTVHPSTLQAMSEMNLLESYLEKPFQKTDRLSVVIDEKEIPIGPTCIRSFTSFFSGKFWIYSFLIFRISGLLMLSRIFLCCLATLRVAHPNKNNQTKTGY